MGRNRRWQASHAQLRFLKMFRPGMYICLFSALLVEMSSCHMAVFDRALSQGFT
jgi:hypothetical protein